MEKFGLLHTTLYAKGWYLVGDIWEDLKVLLTLDDYNGEVMRKGDIIGVLLNQCQLLNVRGFKDLMAFASGIDEGNAYKNGYQYQGMPFQPEGTNLPAWDYHESIVRYCLSVLRFIGRDEITMLPRPDYVNGLKKNTHIKKLDVDKMFG